MKWFHHTLYDVWVVIGPNPQRAKFLTLATTDVSSQMILGCGVLACVLKDVEQHPWLLPTRCQ